jgi:hypothetical protein
MNLFYANWLYPTAGWQVRERVEIEESAILPVNVTGKQ